MDLPDEPPCSHVSVVEICVIAIQAYETKVAELLRKSPDCVGKH